MASLQDKTTTEFEPATESRGLPNNKCIWCDKLCSKNYCNTCQEFFNDKAREWRMIKCW